LRHTLKKNGDNHAKIFHSTLTRRGTHLLRAAKVTKLTTQEPWEQENEVVKVFSKWLKNISKQLI
jgi:hypothetical protein